MIALSLRIVLWVVASGSAALFTLLAARRLFYPLELDCIEGVMMDHIVRLAHGQPLYVQPSLEFIPLAYMPLYPALAAPFASVLGPDFWQPRLISLLAVMGSMALAVKIVRNETESWTLAASAAAIYLMGFGLTGSCYDVARPDSLMLFLVLAAFASLRFSTGQAGAVSAALLFALAFFTKQHAAVFALAAIAHLVINERHRLLVFGLWLSVFVGIGMMGLSYWLGPWFTFYTIDVPSRWSQFSAERMVQYLGDRVFGHLGVLAGAALLSLGLAVKPWRGRDGIWMWAALGALGTGLLATFDPEAYRHSLMPTMLMFSILGPISLHRIATEMTLTRTNQLRATMGVMCGALAFQFLPLVYTVHTHLPRPRAAEARRQFVADLKARSGPVLVPYHGFYSWSAGKGTSLHIIPLDDLLRAPGNRLLRYDPGYFDRLFQPLAEGGQRPEIVTDVRLDVSGKLWTRLARGYALSGNLGWLSEPLRPVTGNQFTPTYLYVPRPLAAPGEGTLGKAPDNSSQGAPLRDAGGGAAPTSPDELHPVATSEP